MADFPDAGTELVDADEAVDGMVGGEYLAQRSGRLGDRLARPCEARGEEFTRLAQGWQC